MLESGYVCFISSDFVLQGGDMSPLLLILIVLLLFGGGGGYYAYGPYGGMNRRDRPRYPGRGASPREVVKP